MNNSGRNSLRLLVVTEKCGPEETQRDGGARLVATLRRAFGDALSIIQFGPFADPSATWHRPYPTSSRNRFVARLERAGFIADEVTKVAAGFTDVLFIHISMQFGLPRLDARTWTFPMFLSPSYTESGERVPEAYTKAEHRVLASTDRVLTPSHMERRQLVELYGVGDERIRVVPRGVDRCALRPRERSLDGPPRFCSVGSIKRQKNTVGLIELFAAICDRYPEARLRLIGPVQDVAYGEEVDEVIRRFGLDRSVERLGYVAPHRLADAIDDAHVHLSASTCETFGRAIFETLASGLPNVARRKGNAAAEFLANAPYAHFCDDLADSLAAIDIVLQDLQALSALATEVGSIFDEFQLSRLLVAEITDAPILCVADWDGTLFHKDDPDRTSRAFAAFRKFPLRVVCTARTVVDISSALMAHQLEVDWIVGCSGAVVADGAGRTLWIVPLNATFAGLQEVLVNGQDVQAYGPEVPPIAVGWRIETYQGISFISRWEASKLRGVLRLLRHLDWRGRVRAFGDGKYDEELLMWFDGTLIRPEQGVGLIRSNREFMHE